jgi:hypothetical protein
VNMLTNQRKREEEEKRKSQADAAKAQDQSRSSSRSGDGHGQSGGGKVSGFAGGKDKGDAHERDTDAGGYRDGKFDGSDQK